MKLGGILAELYIYPCTFVSGSSTTDVSAVLTDDVWGVAATASAFIRTLAHLSSSGTLLFVGETSAAAGADALLSGSYLNQAQRRSLKILSPLAGNS